MCISDGASSGDFLHNFSPSDSSRQLPTILKTTGSGGRAGRVQQEVLVALSELKAPDGDAQVYANVEITLTSPSAATVVSNTSNGNSASFTVGTALVGNTAATLSYQWQVNSNTGALGWTNVANSTPTNTGYLGGTTATLLVYPKTAAANAYVFRAVVTAADQGVSATSAMIADSTIVDGDISATANIAQGKIADILTNPQTASYTLVLADKLR